MIAAGEDFVARDADEAAKLAEDGAFGIIGVAEADVAGVALEGEEGHLLARGFDEGDDAVHLALVLGDEADGAGVVPDGLGAGLALDEMEDAVEQGLGLGVEIVVGLGAALIPIAKGLPAAAVAFAEDVALAGEDEVGLDGECEFIQAVDDVAKVASGVDGPEDAGFAQVSQQGDQLGDDRGMLEMIDERAVEVRGEEFDHGAGGRECR